MKKPLRIVVLFSGACDLVSYLSREDTAHFSVNYEIVNAFSDREASAGREALNCLGIHNDVISFEEWRSAEGIPQEHDIEMRRPYFEILAGKIKDSMPDLILCDGFKMLFADDFIAQFSRRIIAVHQGDLGILGFYHERALAVKQPILRAAFLRYKATCSTAFFIEKGLFAEGEIITISPPLNFPEGNLSAEVLAVHARNMSEACDGPACLSAIKMIYDENSLLG